MHDDVAWEIAGAPTELQQLKLHVTSVRALTDASDDLWRTLLVWMDHGRPSDPYGPILTLITNSSAADGSAASFLRDDGRDPDTALAILERTAQESKAAVSRKSRERFLGLSSADRATFVHRIHVADRSPGLDQVDGEVEAKLLPGAPVEQFDLYVGLVWAWWSRTSLALLQGQRPPVSVQETRVELERIRDQFTLDNLPSLIGSDEIDLAASMAAYEDKTFVRQLNLIGSSPRQLEKAILDYQRAYLHETRWVENHLIGYDMLSEFTDRLVDEWEREFDHICLALPADATEDDKRAAGRDLLHTLSNSLMAIRTRFQDPSHARGRRHDLADKLSIGWHPEFEQHLAELLIGS